MHIEASFLLDKYPPKKDAKKCLPSEKFNHINIIFGQLSTDSDIFNKKDNFRETNSFFMGLNKR